jgi:hypothetical protein
MSEAQDQEQQLLQGVLKIIENYQSPFSQNIKPHLKLLTLEKVSSLFLRVNFPSSSSSDPLIRSSFLILLPSIRGVRSSPFLYQ